MVAVYADDDGEEGDLIVTYRYDGLNRRIRKLLGTEAGEVVGYVRDACRYWGHTINRAYGEPFAVQETLGLTSLDAVL